MLTGGVWITLTPADIAVCTDLAHKRRNAAIKRGGRSTNNAPMDNEAAWQRDLLGTHTEFAAKCYFEWGGHPDLKCSLFDVHERPPYPKEPDLTTPHVKIDVKGAPEAWHSLFVQRNDPPDWAYLLVVGCPHPTYHIVSWCWGREAQALPLSEPRQNRGVHQIKQGNLILKPVNTLFDISKGKS